MLRVRHTHTARAGLTDIAEYIEQQSRPELGEGRRALLISPYIAFYRVEGGTVYVRRILHAARNITQDLLDEPT